MIIPRIETFKETKLVGKKITMSYANNKTVELWKSFSPRRKEIKNLVGRNRFSVEIYPDATFFENFNPEREYEKWAAVEVSEFDLIPDGLERLIIPEDLYAVFHYKGKPSGARETFHYIFSNWLPNAEYKMDARPYFALMGEKYKGEFPDSEEEFWVPIKRKSN